MELRPYQSDAVSSAWKHLREKAGNPAIVIPTAGGKSLVMAALARQAVQEWGGRVGIVAPSQELVFQNADKLSRYWPGAPIGIYSASLGRRDRFDPVLSLQIQSSFNKADQFGAFDLLLVDEAHMIPLRGEGRYRTFLSDCKAINPRMRVIGLTATPYRLQGGNVPVCFPGGILDEVAYEAYIPDLIAAGYLCPLSSKSASRPDLSGVHVRGGEYVESEVASVMLGLVDSTLDDMVRRTADRKAIIVFCSSIDHAEAVTSGLRSRGHGAACVHGGSTDRDETLSAFNRGEFRYLVNVNVLTTGYDEPRIDCVVMLRPTKSAGLYVQMVGRGFRLHQDKIDCLVLDYAGNIIEHGPVDEIRVEPARGSKPATIKKGESKTCPNCDEVVPIAETVCPSCSHEFKPSDRAPSHSDRPVDAPILASEREPIITEAEVTRIRYERGYGKEGKPDHLRVTHQCGIRRFTDYVCLEHRGMAREKAVQWWMERSGGTLVPGTVAEALACAASLRAPVKITVDETEKFPRIIGAEYGEKSPYIDIKEDPASNEPDWLQSVIAGAK